MTVQEAVEGHRFAFDQETAIETVGDGQYRTRLTADWNIHANPNGGYALSSLVRAMRAELHADLDVEPEAGHELEPASVTVHFLRPALSETAAEIQVSVLRRGRRNSTVRASLGQEGKSRLEAIATFSDLTESTESNPTDRLTIEPPEMPRPEHCPIRTELTLGVELPLLSRVEVRVDPRFVQPGEGGIATMNGWLRFVDGRPSDASALPLFADCFPPSIFSLLGRIGWVPTVELTVHVRRKPEPGWIQGSFTTRDLIGGLLIEDGVLWDESGAVVAQCRQLALAGL